MHLFPLIIRKLRLSNACLHIQQKLQCSSLDKPSINYTDALNKLQSIWPNNGKSSLARNTIDVSKEADLQIIIPVYNCGPYIRECLDSVLGQQTHYQFVVFIVDDGSTDESSCIIDTYQADHRVHIIHQENAGPSAARNVALSHLCAEYVMFVDGDDRLPAHAIETLMNEAHRTKADVVEGGFYRFNQNKEAYDYYTPTSYTGNEYDRLSGFVWGKVFHSSLFQRIAFPEGFWYEDSIATYLLYPFCRLVSQIPTPVYSYRKTPNSILHQLSISPRCVEGLWVTKQMLADARELDIPFTEAYFSIFLNDSINTLSAIYTYAKDAEVLKAVLVVLHQLRNEYFPKKYQPRDVRFRWLNVIINRMDSKLCISFIKLMA